MATVASVDADGYKVTNVAIDAVQNDFLDLSSALGKTFYLLEGTYDQVVLEKIFTIIYSSSNKTAVENATNALATAEKNKELVEQLYYALNNFTGSDYSSISGYSTSGIVPTSGGTSCTAAADGLLTFFKSVLTADEYDYYSEVGKVLAALTATGLGSLLDSSISNLQSAVNSATSTANQSTFSGLGTLISTLTTEKSDLETQKSNLQAQLDAITGTTASDLAKKEELQTQISGLTTKINNLGTAITKVTALQSSGLDFSLYSTALTELQNADTALTAAQTAYDAAKTAVTTAKNGQVYDYTGNLEAAQAKLDDAKTKLDEAETARAAALTALTSAESNLSGIETKLSEAKTALNATTSAHKNDLDTLHSALFNTSNGLKKRITDAKTSATNAATNIATAKTDVTSDVSSAMSNAKTKAVAADNSGVLSLRKQLAEAISAYKAATTLEQAAAAFAKIEPTSNALAAKLQQISQESSSNLKNTNGTTAALSTFSSNYNGGTSDGTATANSKLGILKKFDAFYKQAKKLPTCADQIYAALMDTNISTFMKSKISNFDTLKANITTYYSGGTLKNLSAAEFKSFVLAVSTLLGTASSNVTSVYNGLVTAENTALTTYNNATAGYDADARPEDLLNYCLLASTPQPDAQGKCKKIAQIERVTNDDGTYSYKIVYSSATVNLNDSKVFSKADAYSHTSLPYMALAIMYEKTCIQQISLLMQLDAIEMINAAIEENNKMMRALTWMYDKVYSHVSLNQKNGSAGIASSDLQSATGVKMADLDAYLKKISGGSTGLCGTTSNSNPGQSIWDNYSPNYVLYNNGFYFAQGHYDVTGQNIKDTKGDNQKDTSNIDVHEQAVLTLISNKQDSVRIYGDELSSDSQIKTTKMQQYMQNANTAVSTASQVVKSLGEYLKATISNIR
ncbi:MAG: hypothetical protein LBT64_00165 [Puniceicoccales bacterium]|jgi:predicted  nucleic acid-binding Zn-ribbon protein|nr:hypothetical protein [Puniceicoccales bacterium]